MKRRQVTDFQVLVIDRVSETASVMELVLENTGESSVTRKASLEEGLAHLKEGTTDIVILDASYPDKSSLRFCEDLNANEEFGHTPIILVSDENHRERMFEGFESGAVDFMTKPLYASELAARVQTHVDLKRQKDLTNRKVVEQRELLQLMCHDVSGPVGSVKMAIEMCERDPSRFATTVQPIKATLDRILELTDLVRQMRAFEDGKFEFNLQAWPVASLVEQAIDAVAHRIEAKSIIIEQSLPPKMAVAVEAVSFINSVMANLLSNAVKFSEPESVIEVGATEQNGRVYILVEDRGIGMPAKLLGKLFDPNHPTNRPGTKNEPGTGFGMLLVKKFVEAYGGTILIESRDISEYPDNSGTQIILNLPKG